MSRPVFFITHPNVVISREVPVPRWPLSELGLARMRKALELPWVRDVTAVYSSSEQKAIDGARIVAQHLALEADGSAPRTRSAGWSRPSRLW